MQNVQNGAAIQVAVPVSKRPESNQRLRVVIVQNRVNSPEANVVATLLASMRAEHREIAPPAVLLIQVGSERPHHGNVLREMPNVEELSVDIGGSLGVPQPKRRTLGYFVRLLLALPMIVARVWRFRPTAVYSSQQRWDVRLATMLAMVTRAPHVIHLHYVPGPWLGGEVLWRLRHCRLVICVSDFIRGLALEAGVPAERCMTIRNVLDPRSVVTTRTRDEARADVCRALSIPPDDVLVGMVARLDRGKGQLELVQAMAPLLARPDAHCQLILVGQESYPDDGYAGEVLRCAEHLGVAHAVHWLGPRPRSEVPSLLRAFDVFAHPSFNEPCPLAVVEALLAGLPCVSWRDGGQAELIVDQRTGLLAETGNVAALTDSLDQLCSQPELRASMAAAALADAGRLADTVGAAAAFRAGLEGVLTTLSAR